VNRVVFWVCVASVLYTYAGYPMLIAVLARLRPRAVRHRTSHPTVTILIVAHDEARWIGRKIESCLALDYPRTHLDIVVASDGSTDATAEIARKYEPQGVSVLVFEMRRGKPSVLNAVVPTLRGDVIMLADTRQVFDRHALAALVRNFADPDVGAVSGELVVSTAGAAGVADGVGFYWRYEKAIRRHESCYDSTVGATGAIYAIRRTLFTPIPADTLLDDVAIPMNVVRRGYRVLFEPGAQAFDEASDGARQEFTRKVRTIAGNFQLFLREPWLVNPWQNRLWLQTVSHKGLRLLGPAFLTGIVLSNITLYGEPFYVTTLALQLLFYAVAAAGHVAHKRGHPSRWLTVPYTFCFLNAITLVSFYRFIAGRQAVTWTKAK
jgi:cellulose synthase/poly-beta-1,6-N-acetylglucosamine synthase-like glycosyltransferase